MLVFMILQSVIFLVFICFFFFLMIRRPPRSTLFLHDALPICEPDQAVRVPLEHLPVDARPGGARRSEEHTSELQSRENLVCRLLPEKKNKHARTSGPAQADAHLRVHPRIAQTRSALPRTCPLS